jgi:hypothetical protein
MSLVADVVRETDDTVFTQPKRLKDTGKLLLALAHVVITPQQ